MSQGIYDEKGNLVGSITFRRPAPPYDVEKYEAMKARRPEAIASLQRLLEQSPSASVIPFAPKPSPNPGPKKTPKP